MTWYDIFQFGLECPNQFLSLIKYRTTTFPFKSFTRIYPNNVGKYNFIIVPAVTTE